MKKLASLVLALIVLSGCTGKRDELDRAMALRAELLGCESCGFDVAVTADYGDSVLTFGMNCQGDNRGKLTFQVTQPESIAGITGVIDLTFPSRIVPTVNSMFVSFPPK